MKFLVATKQSQGQKKNDFFWAEEGEPIIFGLECDHEEFDGACGCKRSLSGVRTAKATTTMMVAEVNSHVVEKIAHHYIKDWNIQPEKAHQLAVEMLFKVHSIAEAFPLGTVLGRCGDAFYVRGTRLFTVYLLSPYASWEGVKGIDEQDAIDKTQFPLEIDLNDGPFHWVAIPEAENG